MTRVTLLLPPHVPIDSSKKHKQSRQICTRVTRGIGTTYRRSSSCPEKVVKRHLSPQNALIWPLSSRHRSWLKRDAMDAPQLARAGTLMWCLCNSIGSRSRSCSVALSRSPSFWGGSTLTSSCAGTAAAAKRRSEPSRSRPTQWSAKRATVSTNFYYRERIIIIIIFESNLVKTDVGHQG